MRGLSDGRGGWEGSVTLILYSVSLTTRGSGGTAHTCSGRHSQYSCEPSSLRTTRRTCVDADRMRETNRSASKLSMCDLSVQQPCS